MSIEEIRNKISVINAETARLNTQRNQNIGRQETLKKQFQFHQIQSLLPLNLMKYKIRLKKSLILVNTIDIDIGG